MIFFKRYVDDRFLIVQKDNIDGTLGTFNDGSEDLQFTFDMEYDRKQIFLDTEVCVENDGSLRTYWCKKKRFSGRYINFASHHPIAHMRAIVYN